MSVASSDRYINAVLRNENYFLEIASASVCCHAKYDERVKGEDFKRLKLITSPT
jgi:hypothetical protein